MKFGDKLKELLCIFAISSRQLSKGIHIDPSSLSRWINNLRIPKQNSDIVDRIIDYFINLDALETQKLTFIKLISGFQNINQLDSIQLRKIFKEWLFSSDVKSEIMNNEQKNTNKLKALSTAKLGELVETEVINGRDGLRKSLVNSLVYLNVISKTHDIYITSQSILFLDSDELIELIKKTLKKGNKVFLLININLSTYELSFLIEKVLPLLLCGNLKIMHFSDYINRPVDLSFFVVSDYAASFSLSIDNICGYTLHYKNSSIAELYKKMFTSLLINSKELVKKYSLSNASEYLNDLVEAEKKHGHRYALKNGLSLLTMPFDLYSKLLDRTNLSYEQKEKRLSIQKRRLEILEWKRSHYIEVCPIDALKKMFNCEEFNYSNIDILSSEHIRAKSHEVIEHLKHTLEILKKYENFEIILCDLEFDKRPMYYGVKETHSIITSTINDSGDHYCFRIDEATVVNAFKEYFLKIINQISPVYRNKQWVISYLQDEIIKLENYICK